MSTESGIMYIPVRVRQWVPFTTFESESESHSAVSTSVTHGLQPAILQAGTLEWVAVPLLQGSSGPRDQEVESLLLLNLLK